MNCTADASARYSRCRETLALIMGEFLTGDALMSYWKKERDVHETMLRNMGVLK